MSWRLVAEQLATADAIILGRESWAEAWPSQSCAPETQLGRGRGRRRCARWRVGFTVGGAGSALPAEDFSNAACQIDC
jgi:hypothetical protein